MRLNGGFQGFLLFEPRDAQVISGCGKGRVLGEGLVGPAFDQNFIGRRRAFEVVIAIGHIRAFDQRGQVIVRPQPPADLK